MDFLDPAKRRAHGVRLFIGYGLMSVLITLAAIILYFYSNGFNLDPKTGEVVRTGLIFVNSKPVSAKIFLNGVDSGEKTDTRLLRPAGKYDIELKADGYRPWKRTLELDGGLVERISYPMLFPETLTPKEEQVVASRPLGVSQSPNRRILLTVRPDAQGLFDRYDLRAAAAAPLSLQLPQSIFTASRESHQWIVVEWSANNRHVLVEHKFGASTEFIILDTEVAGQSININSNFSISPQIVKLRAQSEKSLYIYLANGGVLYSGDVSSRGLSLLASNVLSFKSSGENVVIYATNQGAVEGRTNIVILENGQSYNLRDVASGTVLVDGSSYGGGSFFAVGSVVDKKVFVYKDPLNILKKQTALRPVPSAVLIVDKPEYLSFSPGGQHICLQGGNQFAVYDAENKLQSRYTLVELKDNQPAKWMDGNRLQIINEKAGVFDYNGLNFTELVPAKTDLGILFDEDYKALFSFGDSPTTPGKQVLISYPLILGN